jgi:hypothetical protein
MSVGRRCAALLLAVLALLGVGAFGAASAGAADNPYAADHVVVVGIPGLTWSDVDAAATPQLESLARGSAIGAVSVRAARPTTCLLDGWATLGAGNRARFPGRTDFPAVLLPGQDGSSGGTPQVDASLSRCGLQEEVSHVGLDDPRETVKAIDEDPATRAFGSQAAALGTAVGCADVVGRDATLAVAAPGVTVHSTPTLPADDAALTGLLGGCPLSLVSLDQLTVGQPGVHQTNTGKNTPQYGAAVAGIDAAVGRLRAAIAALPGRTLLIVEGISEVNDSRPHLHVGIVSGPGFSGGTWLESASTGRAPYVELIDVAPTVLQALGIDEPASMNGQAMRSGGSRPALSGAVAELNRIDTAATVHYRSTGDFFWTLVLLTGGIVLAGMLALGGLPEVAFRRGWPLRGRRLPGSRPLGERWRSAVRVVALPVAALPVASYLAGLVPWEGMAQPRWALLASVAGADLLVAAVAGLGPWRRRRLGPSTAVLVITLVTLVADVVTGSNLELNGLLGYDAIVAGRFIGYGNLTFALVCTSALLLTAAVAAAAGRRSRHPRRTTAAVTLLLGLAVVALDGAPQLGRDFGGVLAAVPAFLLLAMLLTRTRVSVARLVAILGAAVVVVGTLAFLDWLRPADQRTHLGRFVQQLIDGDAWTVVSRKAAANISILTTSPLAFMLPVILVAAVWLVRPGGLLRRGGAEPAGLAPRDAGVLRAALLAVGLSLVIGTAVNDSGVALPATAAAVLVPLLVRLAAAPRTAGPDAVPLRGDNPRSGPVEDPDRVTVGSRGSTVWNA